MAARGTVGKIAPAPLAQEDASSWNVTPRENRRSEFEEGSEELEGLRRTEEN